MYWSERVVRRSHVCFIWNFCFFQFLVVLVREQLIGPKNAQVVANQDAKIRRADSEMFEKAGREPIRRTVPIIAPKQQATDTSAAAKRRSW
jgi:hypothetical protein